MGQRITRQIEKAFCHKLNLTRDTSRLRHKMLSLRMFEAQGWNLGLQ